MRKLVPYQLLHYFQSLPWNMLIQSENLVVKYYFGPDKVIYIALDKSAFYDFFLKQDQIKDYLKNTEKRIILIYEDDKIYQRSSEESLKLEEFLGEIGQLANLKISLPTELDLAMSVFEMLRKVQSFVGIEFDEDTCPDTFEFIFKKYILGFGSNSGSYCHILEKITYRGFVRLYSLTFKTWQFIDQFVQTLTPAWPNLKYFYIKSKTELPLSDYQLFTEINLCLPIEDDHVLSFSGFKKQEETRILKKLAVNLLRNEENNQVRPIEVYDRHLGANGVLPVAVDIIVAFNCTIEYEITSLHENYFFISDQGVLHDEILNAAYAFKTHYKLAFVLGGNYLDTTLKFKGTIDQLHVRSFRSYSLKITLDIFPRVKELFLYIRDIECFINLKSNNFQHLQSLTVYIDQDFFMEFIESMYSVFESLKLEKSIAPIVISNGDLINFDEALIFESGWKLLKPTSDAQLFQQVGTIIQDTIVSQ